MEAIGSAACFRRGRNAGSEVLPFASAVRALDDAAGVLMAGKPGKILSSNPGMDVFASEQKGHFYGRAKGIGDVEGESADPDRKRGKGR